MKRLIRFLAIAAILAPFIGFAAEEITSTNTVQELQQLRARMEALEKKIAEASPTAPTATMGRAGSSYMNLSFDVLANAGWASMIPRNGDFHSVMPSSLLMEPLTLTLRASPTSSS